MFRKFNYFPFFNDDTQTGGGKGDETNPPEPTTPPAPPADDKSKKVTFSKEQQEHFDKVFNAQWSKKVNELKEQIKKEAGMSEDELAKKQLEEKEKTLVEKEKTLTRKEREITAKGLLAEKSVPEKWLQKINLDEEDIETQVQDIAAMLSEIREDEKKKWAPNYVPKKGGGGSSTLSEAATLAKDGLSGSSKAKKVTAFD